MRITASDEKIHPNFRMREFLSKDPSLKNGHDLSDKVIEAIFWLREYYDSEIRINSTARGEIYNAMVGCSRGSYHVKGRAIDFSFKSEEARAEFEEDIMNQGYAFLNLRKKGISGFGIYKNFFHLDDRESNCRSEDKYGRFQVWKEKEVFTWIRRSYPVALLGLGVIFLLFSQS